MVVRQGEVYWADFGDPIGSEPGYRRPCVVIQNDLFNRSRIGTLIVCPLSSNMRLANVGGNVLLELSEGGLNRQSVVIVSQVIAIDRSRLDEYVGLLSMSRVRQIIAGIRLVIEPRDVLTDDEGE